jgi:hypothetical protein
VVLGVNPLTGSEWLVTNAESNPVALPYAVVVP